jgi:hypothetical protein
MKYSNPQLPAIVRKQAERAISALVSSPMLRKYSDCPHNSVDHVALVAYHPAYEAIVEYMFTDEALDNDEVAKLMNKPHGLENVVKHAAQWLATTLRKG